MRPLLLLLLFWCLLRPVGLSHAQAALSLAELQIAFWPEYDRPAMLVIYRGVLGADTPLPAALRFQIPARYGPPLAVAFTGPDGQLYNLEHTTTTAGDLLAIEFETPTSQFQFEYYDTSLSLDADTRRYAFSARAPYAVEALTLRLQQPPEAGSVSLAPPFGEPFLAADGLTYYETASARVAADDPLAFELTYIKSGDSLTRNLLGPAAAPEAPQPQAAALGLLALAVAAGGAVWVARSRAQRRAVRPEPARRSRARGNPPRPRQVQPARRTSPGESPAQTASPSPARAAFCHACGQGSQPGDYYCRNCGTELRAEG